MSWTKHESCLIYTPQNFVRFNTDESKIAAFDLDSTLIISDRGEPYSKVTNGFILAYANTKAKINSLYHQGFTIVIFYLFFMNELQHTLAIKNCFTGTSIN